MKLITVYELESTISEIKHDDAEFKKWAKATLKECNSNLMDLINYRMNEYNQQVDAIDILYFVYLGVKIGSTRALDELTDLT